MFQTLPQLHCPFLGIVQPLNAFLAVRGPKVSTGSEMWPLQCQEQRVTALVLGTLLLIQARCHLGTANWCSLTVKQHPSSFPTRLLSSHSAPACSTAWGACDQGQDLVLHLIEQTTGLSPLIQPAPKLYCYPDRLTDIFLQFYRISSILQA